MIFPTCEGEPPFVRDIQVYARNPTERKLIGFDVSSPNLDPMVYALLFPFGEPGWQEGMPVSRNPNHQITMLQYKSAHMALRAYLGTLKKVGNLVWVGYFTTQPDPNLFYPIYLVYPTYTQPSFTRFLKKKVKIL